MAEIILETKDLKKHYQLRGQGGLFGKKAHLAAVDGVSLKVIKGETLGIVGESGCGKSTFSRLVTQLTDPTSGEVLFKGRSLTNADNTELKALRRNMQMIFQNPYASLNPRKRVLDLLTEPLKIHGIGDRQSQTDQALAMLERVGLQKSYGSRFPHEFSGGQCQRINIARALMLQPEVLICDEPVSALDVSIQAQVINLLIELQEQLDLTYIFISHDLNIVQYFCDQIAVMYAGKVVEYGPAERVYRQPQHDYTKKLLAAIPGKKRIMEEA